MVVEGKQREVSNKTRYFILAGYALSLVIFGMLIDTPAAVGHGISKIIREPGLLITDYIVIGGMGAAFVNAGLLTLASILVLYFQRIAINGVSVAAVFLMAGFALFGKNLFNIWLILAGVYIYSRIRKEYFSKYVYIALFGTSMAPMISEIIFNLGQPLWLRVFLGITVGLGIGFVLPPLSSYLLRVHQGYNLYNIGFTAGIIGTVAVSVLKSYGLITKSNMIWSKGSNLLLGTCLAVFFLSMLAVGYFLNNRSFTGLRGIFSRSGRLVTDFVLLEGFGVSLINMGLNGLAGLGYILLVGGDLNGPTMGGILTMVGFGAFGKHLRNILPIWAGVFLGSLTKIWHINDPPILLAALFGTALAPIAGQFGVKYGVAAGFILSSVVLNVGVLHGGFNLYNTGFAAGIVAAVMLPMIEAFRKEETV